MIVKFNKNIYKKDAILMGIKAFSKISSFDISENRNYFLVKIKSDNNDQIFIKNEFSNYILYSCK